MASNETVVPEPADALETYEGDVRRSDVVPVGARNTQEALELERRVRGKLFPGALPHLSWPEGLRVPDETRSAWMNAYEAGFDHAFESCERGDELIPLVYAAAENDERLVRAMVRFIYEVALELDGSQCDEAFAMLEVAESAIEGRIGKDTCARIAANLVDEAYARFERDRRFDRYFLCHAAAAVARLAAEIQRASSSREALEAMSSAVAAVRMHHADAEPRIMKLAARCIRDTLRAGMFVPPF